MATTEIELIDSESPLDNSGAARVLKENSVMITRNVNLTALKPYLIENDCITLDEARQFHTEDSRSDNSIKLISIISQRGVGAFNGFIKALRQFTTDERGEGAHKELLETLLTSIQRVSLSQSQRGELSLPSTSYERPAESARQGNGKYSGIPKFVWLLRLTSGAMILFSPLLVVSGVTLIIFSGKEFAGDIKCEGVGSAYSLSIFNFCFGVLCLSFPGLLIMFCLYFGCEDHNTKWKDKLHATRCLVWMTIVFFLAVFILIVFELLFSLLYIVPEIVSSYSDWEKQKGTNETLCDSEIYVSSFSIITVSYAMVFLLLVVLGVYLANLYFKWVIDEDNPGYLRTMIYMCLHKDRSICKEISTETTV